MVIGLSFAFVLLLWSILMLSVSTAIRSEGRLSNKQQIKQKFEFDFTPRLSIAAKEYFSEGNYYEAGRCYDALLLSRDLDDAFVDAGNLADNLKMNKCLIELKMWADAVRLSALICLKLDNTLLRAKGRNKKRFAGLLSRAVKQSLTQKIYSLRELEYNQLDLCGQNLTFEDIQALSNISDIGSLAACSKATNFFYFHCCFNGDKRVDNFNNILYELKNRKSQKTSSWPSRLFDSGSTIQGTLLHLLGRLDQDSVSLLVSVFTSARYAYEKYAALLYYIIHRSNYITALLTIMWFRLCQLAP